MAPPSMAWLYFVGVLAIILNTVSALLILYILMRAMYRAFKRARDVAPASTNPAMGDMFRYLIDDLHVHWRSLLVGVVILAAAVISVALIDLQREVLGAAVGAFGLAVSAGKIVFTNAAGLLSPTTRPGSSRGESVQAVMSGRVLCAHAHRIEYT